MSVYEKYGWLVVIVIAVFLSGIRLAIPKKTVEVCIKEPAESVRSEDYKKILLNKASAEDLMYIPGIGEKLANEIILYRTENGYFRSYEELILVPGIGETKIDKIKEYYNKKGY